MKYVMLLVYFGIATAGQSIITGSQIALQDFQTQALCDAAKRKIEEESSNKHAQFIIVCFPVKGDER